MTTATEKRLQENFDHMARSRDAWAAVSDKQVTVVTEAIKRLREGCSNAEAITRLAGGV